MQNRNKNFINGLIVKPKHENAPDFVKGRIAIHREEMIEWLQGTYEEWLNLDILENKRDNMKWFAKINTWKKSDNTEQVQVNDTDEIRVEDLPFQYESNR